MNSFIRALFPLTLIVLMSLSCAAVRKRMPAEMKRMNSFLTQDNPDRCRQYHYNFERQAPRLYAEREIDSLLDVIEYIKEQCGPSSDLEVTRMLIAAENNRFDDTLVGTATIGQMLWYRTERDYQLQWEEWYNPFDFGTEIDNTHEHFQQFQAQLADSVAVDSSGNRSGRIIGQFFSEQYDSALTRLQQSDMRETALQKSYLSYVGQVKRRFPTEAHAAFLAGSWVPQGNNRLLGKHPELGLQIGAEAARYRGDVLIAYRFSSAKNPFEVDSLGVKVSTTKFNSWLWAVEGGYKFIDGPRVSTDVFVGVGYDYISSITLAGNPQDYKMHSSPNVNFGLRQRFFVDKRSGWYVGAIVRYNIVGYGNPGGTSLSGNTLAISFVTGRSSNATLREFLSRLNYKGDWRQR